VVRGGRLKNKTHKNHPTSQAVRDSLRFHCAIANSCPKKLERCTSRAEGMANARKRAVVPQNRLATASLLAGSWKR
jgi:hypothetical protein